MAGRLKTLSWPRDEARIDLRHFSDWQRRWISMSAQDPVQLISPAQRQQVGHTVE
jgi:hypothetical protein